MDSLTIILIIILSIGLTQGFIFSIILWNKSQNGSAANKYQALLLSVLSYGLLNRVLLLFGIGYFDIWYHLTLDLEWSYGPLLFLYVKAQAQPTFKLTRKHFWVISPIIIQIICSIYVRSQNFFWDGTKDSLSWLGYYGYVYWRNYSSVPIIASLLIIYYSWQSLKLLRDLKPIEVNTENLLWVRRMVKSFGAYYILVLAILVSDLIIFLLNVGPDYFYFTRFYYYPFFIGMAFLVYWFGISSILQEDRNVVKLRKEITIPEQEQLNQIKSRLQDLMNNEQIYQDQELTLTKLAEKLDIKPYLLTKTLNEVCQRSFTDYVNEYRVKELEQLLKDPANDKFTLLSIGYDVGFNSKSSFNRAVKKHLGTSPSQLKRR
ncbi:MAG: AraC family transcriptional regulator [Ekhidna sp.]|nr:AraC family transcriptional regulator [Ekhidna sp.]